MLCKWRNVLVPLAYLSPPLLPIKIDWVYLNHRLCSQEAGRLPDMQGILRSRVSPYFSLWLAPDFKASLFSTEE